MMVQSLPSRISPDLRHATRLIALEVAEAREEKRKEGTAYVSSVAASPARTPDGGTDLRVRIQIDSGGKNSLFTSST
jgi:hypothetical protein